MLIFIVIKVCISYKSKQISIIFLGQICFSRNCSDIPQLYTTYLICEHINQSWLITLWFFLNSLLVTIVTIHIILTKSQENGYKNSFSITSYVSIQLMYCIPSCLRKIYTKSFSVVVICSDYLTFLETCYSTHCKCSIIRFPAGTCCKIFMKKRCVLIKELMYNYFLLSYTILGYLFTNTLLYNKYNKIL